MKTAYSKDYPKTHLLNPARPYVSALKTDIRATFERVRNAQAIIKEAK